MNDLYRSIGISKQAVFQYQRRQEEFTQKVSNLVLKADELRRAHPGCGVEKMYHTLRPDFIGRDRFIEVMMSLGYRLSKKRNYMKTTKGTGVYFPNLIEGKKVGSANEIWQSDITYIRVKDRFYYVVFIVDVYTKKIVGYSLSDHMRASANMRALEMALRDNPAPRYHHSDRGSQYISKEYVRRLKDLGTQPSMGKIAQENAYAERLNGTIKNEFINRWKPQSYVQLRRHLKKAVEYYNTKRPHNAIDKRCPKEMHQLFKKKNNQIGKPLTIFTYEKV